jgi:L-threonylcarbamoyladenylate synthase
MKKQIRSLSEIITAHTPGYSERAAAVIRGGGIIAFPTETYYGLGVDPFNIDGLESLFKLKQRSLSKAILLIIDNLSQLDRLITSFPEPYQALIDSHWPGALTLIFPALSSLPELLTGGSGTIGIRMSSNEIATRICKSSGTPISATSANISGEPPAASVEEVVRYFGDKIDLIIDGGKAAAPQCSTIAAIQGGRIRVVRSGMIRIKTD